MPDDTKAEIAERFGSGGGCTGGEVIMETKMHQFTIFIDPLAKASQPHNANTPHVSLPNV